MSIENKIASILKSEFIKQNSIRSIMEPKLKLSVTVNEKNHIFYALLNYTIKQHDIKVRFSYIYSLHQKLLRASINRDWNLASFFCEKLMRESARHDLSELERNATLSIINPAIAFYHYQLKKDFVSSLEYISASLYNIDLLIENGFSDGIFMKIEQKLNAFRVQYSAKEYFTAHFYANEVLSYLLGMPGADYQIPFKELIRSSEQHREIIHLFLNSIISKAVGKGGITEINHDFLSNIFLPINLEHSNYDNQIFTRSFQAFKYLLSENVEAALDILTEIKIFNQEVPVFIQYYFINFLLNYPQIHMLVSTEEIIKLSKWRGELLSETSPHKKPQVENIEKVA